MMKIFRRKYPFKKKDCPHMHIRNIYGDEIRYAKYNRSECTDCGMYFKQLNGR